MDLREPNHEGECDQQYLELDDIPGASHKICGFNNDQHCRYTTRVIDLPKKNR